MRRALFWGSAATAGWVLVGYPAWLALLPRRGAADAREASGTEPRVSIIVPAFTEHEALAVKLRALRELDFPADRLQVVVAIDEDERLAEVARDAMPEAVISFGAERAGKSAALRRALGVVDGDVVVLTDANNVLDRGSIRAAVALFADPQVLGVAGRRGEADSAYDRYEDLIRRLESRSGSVAAMSGEFMAVRREALPPFPPGVVNDDLWLLCQLVRAGGRVLYEPAAHSTEDALGASAELERRARIGAGRAMLVGELASLPRAFAFRLVSHKFGRLALPFLLAGAFAASLTLARRRPYGAFAALQGGAYALGAAGAAGVAPAGPAGRPARILGQFLVGNVAIGMGVVRAARGRQRATREPVR